MTTRTRNVTRKQAEAALEAIKEQFKDYLGAGYPEPVLDMRWESWNDGSRRVAILWEEGPDDWAFRANDGGYDEELSFLAEEFTGEKTRVETPAATTWPKGVWGEPYVSFILCLYPIGV